MSSVDQTSSLTLSVILPVYNEARRLRRCVEGVLEQTHRALELIVVDDGSRDDTGMLLHVLAKQDARIRPVYAVHGGQLRARMLGIEAAAGEYVNFIDADDAIEKTMYEELLPLAERYDADVVHCGYQKVFPDKRREAYWGSEEVLAQDRVGAMKRLLSMKHIEMWCANNKLYRRKLFSEELREDLKAAQVVMNEDLLLNFRVFQQAYRIVGYDKCLYHYNVRDDSTTHTVQSEQKLFEPLAVRRRLLSEAEDGYRAEAARFYLRSCIKAYDLVQPNLGIDHAYCARLRALLAEQKDNWGVLRERERSRVALLTMHPLEDAKIRHYLQKEASAAEEADSDGKRP